MKKIFIVTTILFWVSVSRSNAQTGINTNNINGAALLDFPSGTKKGLILPIVETLPALAVDGTLLMDKNDQKIKMKQNGNWIDMSDTGSLAGVTFNTNPETMGNGIILGSSNSTATGVLVLESTTKALILPKINSPHINVKSPVAGMICYDTTSNCVALFDGINWNYWK